MPIYSENEDAGDEWESQLLEEEMMKHASIVKVTALTVNQV